MKTNGCFHRERRGEERIQEAEEVNGERVPLNYNFNFTDLWARECTGGKEGDAQVDGTLTLQQQRELTATTRLLLMLLRASLQSCKSP